MDVIKAASGIDVITVLGKEVAEMLGSCVRVASPVKASCPKVGQSHGADLVLFSDIGIQDRGTPGTDTLSTDCSGTLGNCEAGTDTLTVLGMWTDSDAWALGTGEETSVTDVSDSPTVNSSSLWSSLMSSSLKHGHKYILQNMEHVQVNQQLTKRLLELLIRKYIKITTGAS